MASLMDTDEEEFELLQLTPPPLTPTKLHWEDEDTKPERRRILLGKRRQNIGSPPDGGDNLRNNYRHRSNNGAQLDEVAEEEEEIITRRYMDPRARQRVKSERRRDESPLSRQELGLLDALGLTPDDLTAPLGVSSACLRPEALHLIGVSSMNTGRVFDYLCAPVQPPPPVPQWLEWVDDNSCNAAYAGWRDALAALASLCSEPYAEVKVSDGSRCLRCTRRVESPSSEAALLVRYAQADDRKTKSANRTSEYYRRHGNPNYHDLAGVISRTYRHRVNSKRNTLEMRKIAENGAAFAAAAAVANQSVTGERPRRRRHSRQVEADEDDDVKSPEKKMRRQLEPSHSGGDLRISLRQMRSARHADPDSKIDPPVHGRRNLVFSIRTSPSRSPRSVSPLLVRAHSPSSRAVDYRVRRQFLEDSAALASGSGNRHHNHRSQRQKDDLMGCSESSGIETALAGPSRLASVVVQKQTVTQPRQEQPRSIVVTRRRPKSPKTASATSASSGSSTSASTSSGSSSSDSESDSSDGDDDSSSNTSSSSSESGSSESESASESEDGVSDAAEWTTKTVDSGGADIGKNVAVAK